MTTAKKIWKFLSSMRFAIILLVVLAVACSIASLVTQGQDYNWYARNYSERTAGLIMALQMDDAFHSWWFLLINGFLCLNLLLCNVLRLPQLINRTKVEGEQRVPARADVTAEGVKDAEAVFHRLRMPAPKRLTTEDGREALLSSKNRAGLWGAWVCHLGILLLIAGFSLGQTTQKEYTVYGVPGQSKPIGDTELVLSIDDFTVGLREDDTVEQYTAEITVYNLTGSGETSQSGTISVNHPATLYGKKFYQNSTGWAATVNVTKDGEPLQQEILCAGEYLRVADKQDLIVYFSAFYPDYVMTPGVGPSTASGALKNPAYLYQVYYMDQFLGMNALLADEELTIDEYTVTFTDPQSYTLIQVKEDHFAWLALIGGLLAMVGLMLAFYVQPVKVWAVKEADGAYTLGGQSRKGGALFCEQFRKAVEQKT